MEDTPSGGVQTDTRNSGPSWESGELCVHLEGINARVKQKFRALVGELEFKASLQL